MFEVEILRNIRETFGGEDALFFWQTVTHLGDAGLVWIVLGLFLVCFPGFRRVGCSIGIALFSGFLICNVLLKPLVDRFRPCELHPEDLLFSCPVGCIFVLVSESRTVAAHSGHFDCLVTLVSLRPLSVGRRLRHADRHAVRLYRDCARPSRVQTTDSVGTLALKRS